MSLAEQLDALLETSGNMMGREMSHFGLTLAKITNITDDKKFNRVKCLPIGAPKDGETDWCYVMSPMGGTDSGLFLFPQVNDLVVLAYLDDDPNRPLVLGSYWNNETTAPLTVQDGKAQDYCLKTPNKIEIQLHDEKEKQTLTVTMPSGTEIKLDDENKKVTVKDKSGDNALTMDLGKGQVELKAKSKLTLSAGKTSITLEDSGNITEKADVKIAMQAANIEGKADGKVALQGGMAEIKADATLQMEGSAMAQLKGGIVKIN